MTISYLDSKRISGLSTDTKPTYTNVQTNSLFTETDTGFVKWASNNWALNPASISNLYVWYDASDSATITKDGSNRVSAWTNKEGTTTRDLVQSSSGSQPLWVSADRNSLDVIDFSSSRQMTSSAELSSISQPITSFLVTYLPASDSLIHFSITEFSLSGNAFHIFYKENDDSWRFSYTSAGAVTFSDATILNSWKYITSIANGASSNIFINGVSKSLSTSGTSNTFAGIRVGEYRATGRYWQNKIAEIIIYNKLLDATERGNVESYLASKWGF